MRKETIEKRAAALTKLAHGLGLYDTGDAVNMHQLQADHDGGKWILKIVKLRTSYHAQKIIKTVTGAVASEALNMIKKDGVYRGHENEIKTLSTGRDINMSYINDAAYVESLYCVLAAKKLGQKIGDIMTAITINPGKDNKKRFIKYNSIASEATGLASTKNNGLLKLNKDITELTHYTAADFVQDIKRTDGQLDEDAASVTSVRNFNDILSLFKLDLLLWAHKDMTLDEIAETCGVCYVQALARAA